VARPKGQAGTIQQLGRTWRIGFWEARPDGRRTRRWQGGFKTRNEAARALRKVLSQLDDGSYVARRADTVGAYLHGWLEAQRPHVAANTWMTCRNHVTYYLAPSEADCAAYRARTGQDRPSLAAVRLQDLSPERASRHLAELLERGRRDGAGLRPRTVRGVRITLNTALASAYASGLLPRPVRVKRVAVPKRAPTVYSPGQTGAFLAVAAADRLAAMWVLLVTSGMRPSEVLGLPWAAVDLDAGVLSIYQKLVKVGNRAVLTDGTKTDRTGASVPQVMVLAPVAAAMLRGWRVAQVEERRVWPWRKERNDLVFTKPDGSPLKPDWLNRRFKQLARQAGLPDRVRVYDLRHGWATAALRAGVHPKLVQEVMRHSSYTTTADTYTHVMPTHSAEAVRAVASLFGTPLPQLGSGAGSRRNDPPTVGPS
jgi:integrase